MKIIQIMPHRIYIPKLWESNILCCDWNFTAAKYLKKYFNLNVESWRLIDFEKEMSIKEPIICRGFPAFNIKNEDISISLIKKLKEYAIRENIIIHLHSMKSFLSALIPILFKNYPIIIQDHGQSPPRGLNRKLIERISFKNIDKFFILTKKYENYLKKFVPEDRILFQPMGVDLDIFKPIDKFKARKELDIENNKKIILFVGTLSKNKNVSVVIKALHYVTKEFPDFIFYIVGNGDEEENLKNLANKLGVVNNIKFCGFIENEKLPLYYSSADLFILPSFYEGFPVVRIEALACNCPVIISDSIENREIINEDRNGLIFKSNDEKDLSQKIIHFFKNQNKFQGEHRKDIEKFSWKNIAKNTVKIYNELSLKYYKESIF